MSTTTTTLTVDTDSVHTVEIVTGDLLGWHPGVVRTDNGVEITLSEADAGRVAYQLRMRGYWVARLPIPI